MLLKLPQPLIGAAAILFSAKSFASAMLALYLALRIGLPNPYWAVVTAYVVAQPRAGAVLSKSMFRVVGTLVGAIVSIWLVPPFVHAPELLALAVSLWVGLCVFASILDRSARSYMFALAGYSSCIIVFPGVMQPSAIFDVAVLRVEEITLGILCSAMVHSLVLPGSVRKTLLERLDAILDESAHMAADILAEPGRPERSAGIRRLVLDINEMHDLLLHAGYETGDTPFNRDALRALLFRYERLLPLTVAVDDRLAALMRMAPLHPSLVPLLGDARAWLLSDRHDPEWSSVGAALQARCHAQEP